MSQQLPLRFKLESHTSLDDYVGAAANRLIELDQFIVIHGETGSGKSHLLQGLCHRQAEAKATALYLPMLTSLEPGILNGLEDSDLVCLDDIDDVLELPEWQSALFHLINACRDHGVKLVLSSTLPVANLKIELPDLSSRLKGAYLVATDKLNDDEKLEVIRIKAKRLGFDMEHEVCAFILSRSRRDMHHLAQLVDQLDEETLRQQKKVTIPFVKKALGL